MVVGGGEVKIRISAWLDSISEPGIKVFFREITNRGESKTFNYFKHNEQ